MPNVPPRDRRVTGYKMMPAEKALAVQFVVITADWPDESKASLRDAILDALDEAHADGIARARDALTADLMNLHEQRDAMCRTLSAFAEGAIQNEGVCLASPSYGDTDTVEIPYCIGDLREAVRLTAYTSKNDTWIKYAGPAKEPA
jgi:hypothetical protein